MCYIHLTLNLSPVCTVLYVHIYNHNYYVRITLTNTVAFRQPATGRSSVCVGGNVTLQCVVVFISADNAKVTVQSNLWSRNISGMITPITTQTPIPNHRLMINSTTGAVTDLVITNVTLEDDNTVYTCSATSANITSSVVLNVTGT